jgi:alkylhydroperoxidase family enzyme
MSDAYSGERRALVEAVTRGEGHLAPAIRSAIVERARGGESTGEIPQALLPLVDRVAREANLVEDRDVEAVLAAGFDEEAVFEAVVAAALGASLSRLEAVDALLEGSR